MIITREQGQRMVVEQYARWKRLACLYCTGFGKGKAALDAVAVHKCDPDDPSWEALIAVHSQSGRDSIWPAQIREWAPHLEKCIGKQIKIMCYHSLKHVKGKTFKWIIADEFHYITEERYNWLRGSHTYGMLMLTATEPDEPFKKRIMREISGGHRLTIKLDTAVNSGVLNNYRIQVWKLDMLQSERSEYIRLCEKVDRSKFSNNPFAVKMALGNRMRFIYDSETKVKAMMYLRDKTRETGKRFVMHCGSIDMANRVSPFRYHSESGDVHYQNFKDGILNEISNVDRIKEGENIDRLEVGIISKVTSKGGAMVQRIGRNMRLEPHEMAIIHILVLKDTYDESWLASALADFDKNKIKYYHLDRANFEHYQ